MGHTSLFLRRVLIVDGAISGTTGLMMFLGAAALEGLLGVPASLLQVAGVSLLPFAAFVIYLSQRDRLSRPSVLTVIALNFAWVAGSIALIFLPSLAPSRLGVAFIAAQALAVLAFAELQWVGLRKAWAEA
jgi:hypothetical protein